MEKRNLYSVSLRCSKTLEDGTSKDVTEQYVVSAVSVSEAETCAYSYMPMEAIVEKCQKLRYSELVDCVSAEEFWEVGVSFITLDERSGKEKRQQIKYLVGAVDFAHAYETFSKFMSGTVVDYVIDGMKRTKFVDFIVSEDE